MILFLSACVVVYGVLFFIWEQRDARNITIKAVLFIMTGFSVIFLLNALGYIVKR